MAAVAGCPSAAALSLAPEALGDCVLLGCCGAVLVGCSMAAAAGCPSAAALSLAPEASGDCVLLGCGCEGGGRARWRTEAAERGQGPLALPLRGERWRVVGGAALAASAKASATTFGAVSHGVARVGRARQSPERRSSAT